MSLELIGARLLTPDFGSTVFLWGSIIGIFLGGLSLGYYFGGKLADKEPNMMTLSNVIIFSALAIIFLVTLN